MMPYPYFKPKRIAGYAALAMCAWALYAIAFYPGIVEIDTVFQIAEFMGYGVGNGIQGSWTSLFPLGTAFVFGSLYKLGLALSGSQQIGIAFILLFQITCLALAASFGCCYLERWGINPKIRLAAFLFSVLIPTSALQAVCLGKDALFAVPFVIGAVCVSECVRTNGASMTRPFWIAASLCSACLMVLFRSSGSLVVAASWGFAFVSLIKGYICETKGVKLAGIHADGLSKSHAHDVDDRTQLNLKRDLPMRLWAIGPIVCAFLTSVFVSVVFSWLGVTGSMGQRELLGTPMQMTTYVMLENPDSVTDREREALNDLYDVELAMSNFEPQMVDQVKITMKRNAPSDATSRFFKAWISLGLKNPVLYAKAYWHLYSGYLKVGTFDSLALPRFIPSQASMAAIGSKFGDGVDIDGAPVDVTNKLLEGDSPYMASQLPEYAATNPDYGKWGLSERRRPARNAVFRLIAQMGEIPVLNMLVSKSLYAFYAPLACVAIWVVRRRSVQLTVLVPLGVMTVLALVGPVDLTRYLVPSLFVLPFSFCLVLFGREDGSKERSANV